ncbi:MAG TPA: zinc ribbon domain-containing protein [Hyphomicrobiaceae bacterium]
MEKPLPRITGVDRPFWEAADSGRLMVQRCQSSECGRHILYPRVCCPYCGGGDLSWEEASGRGHIRSYTFVHRPQHESFYDEAPLCFVAVALEEGPLLYGEVRPRPAEAEQLLDRRVKVVFLEHAAGRKLPYFELEPIS